MKANVTLFLVAILFLMVAFIAFRMADIEEEATGSPPTCTNTTIDAYYKCSHIQPPVMLRKR